MALSFVRWLHKVCLEDEDRSRPYAGVYALGPKIESTIGIDGEFDMDRLSVMIRERFPEDSDERLADLIRAEAHWRMETLEAGDPGEAVGLELAGATCGHRDLAGMECGVAAVPGSVRCVEHGGTVLDASVRRSMLLIAYAKMLHGSKIAVDALMDVAEHSNNDLARVHAAREILDRVGIVHENGAHQGSVEDGSESQDEMVASLKRQLGSARDRLQLVAVPSGDPDDEPVDAEIVE